ncbi:MAG: zinc-dependent alcohol dehydrogenase [Terriglobales bacterium]
MKAVCWQGKGKVGVEQVPEPRILDARDAIVKISSTAICGSDLHLYDGYTPTMYAGDILGHEVKNLSVGDRVVVPFPIACGRCAFCRRLEFALCDNSNPNAALPEKVYGYSSAGIFGYSHMLGGFAGGQAEYARVPFADVGPLKIPAGLRDEQVLFLSDIFPTGYMAAELCNIQPGATVAVWGCGPVGQFALRSARLLGAERVIAIDRFPDRLEHARTHSFAVALNYDEVRDIPEALRDITAGRGPDACIDAVGLEAHGTTVDAALDRVKQALGLEMDRANVLRQAMQACAKGGVVSTPGVYAGWIDKFPFGTAFHKSLRLVHGQTHVQRYMAPLLERIQKNEIDPSFIVTHRMPLDEAPRAYQMFRDKQDQCLKVVLSSEPAELRAA